MLRYAYLLCGDGHEAQDLVQAALLRALPRWSRIRDSEHPDGYMRRVVTTVFLNSRRGWFPRLRLVPSLPERAGEGALDDPAEQVSVRDELATALAALTPRQRAVVVLRYYEGWTDPAIALVLGCGEVAVRSHASRGLARMRDLLTDAPTAMLEDQ